MSFDLVRSSVPCRGYWRRVYDEIASIVELGCRWKVILEAGQSLGREACIV